MPHDAELVAETRGWLELAKNDLGAGAIDCASDPPFTGDAAFHAQQAAEKSMKGFLTWHNTIFRKTHNLGEIGEHRGKIDPAPEPLLRRAAILTDYAWKYRYPGEPQKPPRDEAECALALAREVFEAMIARLPKEVRP